MFVYSAMGGRERGGGGGGNACGREVNVCGCASGVD